MKLIKGILDLGLAGFILVCMLLSVPKLWGYGIYTVASGSMEPRIHTGEVIYTKTEKFENLREGDIITFSMNDGRTTVTHRIKKIDRKERMIQTAGDANREADPTWIGEDSVIGKVIYSVPGLGRVAVMAGAPGGKLYLLAVFLWIAAAQMVMTDIEKNFKRKEQYVYQK